MEKSISKINENIIKQLNSEIEKFHDELFRGFPITLHVENKLLPNNNQISCINILSKRYFTDDNGPTIYGTDIQQYVNVETVKYEFEYSSLDNEYLLKDCEIQGEGDIDWDDLPKEVVKDLHSFCKNKVDDEFCELLEEWYEGLDNINLDDFPKVLKPYIKQTIENFQSKPKK